MADDLLGGLRAAVAFLTTLPVAIKEGDYDGFAHRQYLFVPVAGLIGILLGTAGLALQLVLPAPLAAVFLVAGIYLLTGINHIDGLTDTGDGIVASGPIEKKIKAMKDVHAGAGGLLFMALDLLFLYTLLSLFAAWTVYLIVPICLAEVGAKLAMTTVITFGKSAHEGMGSFMIARAKKWQFIAGMAIALAITLAMAALAIATTGSVAPWRLLAACLAALGAPLVAALALLRIARQNFGGVNGDVIGAANEIARVAALAAMGVVLWMHF